MKITTTDDTALLQATRALIAVNGDTVHSVKQLADYVTKADRFLFPYERFSRDRETGPGDAVQRQSKCLMALASEFGH